MRNCKFKIMDATIAKGGPASGAGRSDAPRLQQGWLSCQLLDGPGLGMKACFAADSAQAAEGHVSIRAGQGQR